MATVAIAILSTAVGGDTTASQNTLVLRDNNGGLYGVLVQATSALQTLGNYIGTLLTKTVSFTAALATDYLCDCTAAAITVTMPPAAANAGVTYTFTKKDASVNGITLTGVLGVSTTSTQYVRIKCICDGTSWFGAT